MRELVLPSPALPVSASAASQVGVIPAIVAGAGERASRRFLEFFAATIRNPNTRAAYHRAVVRFFAWCEAHGLDELTLIEPLHVAAYVEQLGRDFEKPTVKQHLAAVRMLLDWLAAGGILAANPAAPVRGPKHVVKRGRTPVLTADEARQLIDSIDVSTVVGLRDRALIGLMTYTFGRVSAAVAMRVEDYYPEGKRWWVRLHEKGGKEHEMPCHGNLEAWLRAYIDGASLVGGKTYLFRSAAGRTGVLSANPMGQGDVFRMVGRRAAAAGIRTRIGCHSFRATGITNYLLNGGTLEKAQKIANHESARTTKLYDLRDDRLTLDEVERITI